MSTVNNKFHLAFSCHDFQTAKQFYVDLLGCECGRESAHALIMNFGGHQLVAHKIEAPLVEQKTIYPNHFGLIFNEKVEFDTLINKVETSAVEFYIAPKVRFPNSKLEHHSFFLKDPSNNLLEFKYYLHDSAIFAERESGQVGET